MSSYRIDELSVDQLDRIVLPPFQRGFVWTKKKQGEFVETLHDGYPFGTLLVYPENDNDKDSKLLLLDGQQRLSTIRNYKKNPLKFWKPLNEERYKSVHDAVNALLGESSALSESQFDDLLGKGEGDGTMWVLTNISLSGEDQMRTLRELFEIINPLKQEIRRYVNLDQLKVPMIVYLGGKEHIADVFANLNKGGVPLSKYEVFSAAWVGARIQLRPAEESSLQNDILQYVKQYYLDMSEKAEFDLYDFSEDELTQERTITLSELGTALGQYIVDHLNALVPDVNSAAPELGFGVLGVAVGLDNRQLSLLNKDEYRDVIQESLEEILQKVERICNNLQSQFAKLLQRFRAEGSGYENGLSTTFKTLSYFAALWNMDPSSPEYQNALSNIKSAYVFDAITSVWSSHGDQRLMSYYQGGSRNYDDRLGKEAFLKAFDQWIADQTPGINFGKDVKCLVTIHANLSYLSASVPNGESFELEHIVARKRIKASEGPGHKRILGSSLGNCMYLPKGINNPKKDKTLYEVNEHGRYAQLIKESQYFTEDQMDAIGRALEAQDFDGVNDMLRMRSHQVAESLVNSLLSGTLPG